MNISSLFGLVGIPSQSAYCAAKHAVKGFNESLYYELEGTGVYIHSVHPGGVDTGIILNGRHRRGVDGMVDKETVQERFKNLAITTPEKAASVILEGVARRQFRILVGGDARTVDRLQRWMPNGWRKLFLKRVRSRTGRPVS